MSTVLEALTKFKETREFSADTVPAGLLKDHALLEGVFGKLILKKGTLKFIVTETGCEQEVSLAKGDVHIIEPLIRHKVELGPDAVFFIEFFK